MKRIRRQLGFLVLVLALIALALPGTVAAAPEASSALGRHNDAILVDAPTQPTFAIPNVFSLKFGESSGDMEIDLPSLNTIGKVSGLTFEPSLQWNFLMLVQKQPLVTDAVSISKATLNMNGPSKGYSTEAAAQIALSPSKAFQTSGDIAFKYDGMSRQFGFTLANAAFTVSSEPVNVKMTGVNSTPETFSVDSMQVQVPAANATVLLSGYQMKNGKADWKAFTIANAPNTAVLIGDVAKISDLQLKVSGASAGNAASASARVEIKAGKTAQFGGQLFAINDPTTRMSGVGLSNGNIALQSSGWSLQMTGVNSIRSGVKVDTLTLAAEPLALQAEMTGVVVGGDSGFTFDQAKITYTPDAGSSGTKNANNFQMTVTRADAGYIVTTSTMIPVAAR